MMASVLKTPLFEMTVVAGFASEYEAGYCRKNGGCDEAILIDQDIEDHIMEIAESHIVGHSAKSDEDYGTFGCPVTSMKIDAEQNGIENLGSLLKVAFNDVKNDCRVVHERYQHVAVR